MSICPLSATFLSRAQQAVEMSQRIAKAPTSIARKVRTRTGGRNCATGVAVVAGTGSSEQAAGQGGRQMKSAKFVEEGIAAPPNFARLCPMGEWKVALSTQGAGGCGSCARRGRGGVCLVHESADDGNVSALEASARGGEHDWNDPL